MLPTCSLCWCMIVGAIVAVAALVLVVSDLAILRDKRSNLAPLSTSVAE